MLVRLILMDADPAVDLVMHADILIDLILIPTQLHAIHAQIGIHDARLVQIFRVYLRQRNERAPVHRPVMDLRQIGDLDLLHVRRQPAPLL
ncbi:hypothetical protein D3C77_604420 [compost metagenome]